MATITLDRLTTTVTSLKDKDGTTYYLHVQFQDASRPTLTKMNITVPLTGTTQAKIQAGLNDAQNEAIAQYKPIITQYEKRASIDTILISVGAKSQVNIYTGDIASYTKV
jgi:hypothetical protein